MGTTGDYPRTYARARDYVRAGAAVALRSQAGSIIYSVMASIVGFALGAVAGVGAGFISSPHTGVVVFATVAAIVISVAVHAGAEPSPHGRHSHRPQQQRR